MKVGDKVKAGDILAQLDTASLESDIKQAEFNVKNSQTTLDNEATTNQSSLQNSVNSVDLASIELENAKRSYERTKELSKTGASSPEICPRLKQQ